MFVAHRTWNTESVARFHSKRDEQRSKKGLPPFNTLAEEDKTAAWNEERSSITTNEWNWLTLGVRNLSCTFYTTYIHNFTQMKSCPLEKYPLQACIAAADGLLVCPNKFKESRGRSSITKVHSNL